MFTVIVFDRIGDTRYPERGRVLTETADAPSAHDYAQRYVRCYAGAVVPVEVFDPYGNPLGIYPR